MFILFYLVYVGHFLNTIVFFGSFWRPLWLSALGSRLVRLMIAPAWWYFKNKRQPSTWSISVVLPSCLTIGLAAIAACDVRLDRVRLDVLYCDVRLDRAPGNALHCQWFQFSVFRPVKSPFVCIFTAEFGATDRPRGRK